MRLRFSFMAVAVAVLSLTGNAYAGVVGVPEPATGLLVLAGIGAVMLMRRKIEK